MMIELENKRIEHKTPHLMTRNVKRRGTSFISFAFENITLQMSNPRLRLGTLVSLNG
jgi:hypothetical protein